MPVRPLIFVGEAFLLRFGVCILCEHPHRHVAHGAQPDPGAGQPAADRRALGRAVFRRQVGDQTQLAGEPHLLAERRDAAFEAQEPHGDCPALAWRADHAVGSGARAVEEDGIEFTAAADLPDRVDLDAGLVERHQQEYEPAVARRTFVAAGKNEYPVGEMGERGPDFLPRDDPLSAFGIEAGARLYIGKVGACVGLGIALAPEFAAVADQRQEALLLLFRPKGDEGGSKQAFADMAETARSAGTGILLLERDLLGNG